jgi:hypothetical protein
MHYAARKTDRVLSLSYLINGVYDLLRTRMFNGPV